MEFTEHQRAPRVMKRILIGATVFSLGIIGVTSLMFALDGHTVSISEVLLPMGLEIIIFGALLTLFWRSTLNVSIDHAGVHVRFTPFHRTPRTFAWNDIERIIVRKVSPFGEFGGWGIRWNFGKGTGYVWRGTTGIDLRMRDGRRIVITIEDVASASEVIHAVVPTGVEYEQRIAAVRN